MTARKKRRQEPTLQIRTAFMQDLNWNDIRVFLAVARTGQVGRAARMLKLDPTTLSRRIKRLEGSLEQTLFERTRDGQTLTEAGEALLAKAEPMEASARQIEDERNPDLGLSGTLRLSVSEGFRQPVPGALSRRFRAIASKFDDRTSGQQWIPEPLETRGGHCGNALASQSWPGHQPQIVRLQPPALCERRIPSSETVRRLSQRTWHTATRW